MKDICVVGLGYIGLPTAILLADAGYRVLGVDIKAELVESLSRGVLPIAEPGLGEAFRRVTAKHKRLRFGTVPRIADAFLITVQTPFEELGDGRKTADLRHVWSACRSVGEVLRPGNLVVLESTVPPRTTEKMAEVLAGVSGLFEEDFYTAHCPERVIPGRILEELRQNDRVVGADNEQALSLAGQLYESVLTTGHVRRTDTRTAELCKLVENAYRDVNIAFANELSQICEAIDIDVFALIRLANCHPRVHIHRPGVGVGGHCIAVDPWFIHEAFPDRTPLIETARRGNDSKPAFVAGQVFARLGRPEGHVCVLGLSYKPNIDDLRESPSLALCEILSGMGFTVSGCEPNVPDKTIRDIPNLSLEDALKADFVVVALAHRQFVENKEMIEAVPHYDCVGLLSHTY